MRFVCQMGLSRLPDLLITKTPINSKCLFLLPFNYQLIFYIKLIFVQDINEALQHLTAFILCAEQYFPQPALYPSHPFYPTDL